MQEKTFENKYVYSIFISPSGKGLKAIVKIPPLPDNHVSYFNSLEKHFNSPQFDKTCKNVSRVCYESYDPLIHINENASVWDKQEEKEYTEVIKNVDLQTIPITDENKIVEILVKWWQKKYPMSVQRNNNAYVLAAAFNDYGVSKTLAEYVLGGFETTTFKRSEIKRTVDSAYAQIQNFGTKYYEDDEKVNMIKHKLKRGVSKKELRTQLTELDPNLVENVNRLEGSKATISSDKKRERCYQNCTHIFQKFLEENGFYKFCPEGSKNYVFVKVTNNLITTSEKEIKDYIQLSFRNR